MVRHIGLSNFTMALLDEAWRLTTEPFAVEQIEYHPYLDQSKMLAALRRRGMAITAYCPIALGRVVGDPVIEAIGAVHRRTAAQVTLRWLVQQPDVIAIPRSSKPARLAENLAVFDFSLSDAEMAQMSALTKPGQRIINEPQWVPNVGLVFVKGRKAMTKNWTRRGVLKGSAASMLGLSLPMPFISRAMAASGKIVVGMEAGSPYDTFYKKHAPEFTAKSGVTVEFISIPHDNIRQQFVLDALSAAGGFDVYIADQVWLPEFYEKGFIRDLSSLISDADRSDFSKTALETVTYKGVPVALPVMVHNCAMYYRTDLFEKAGLSAPPKTWDEYRDFAAKTTDTAAGVWGTLIASKQGIEASTRLHSFYQQAGGDLLDASGKPTINSDAGRAALEFMTKMVFEAKAAPEGVLELSDMQGMWLEGKLAMAPVWPYLYSLSKEPLGGKFSVATAPGSVNPGGTVYSWGFAAASAAKNPDGAVRVHQMGNQHRPALWLRQGMAEPGSPRLGDRPHCQGCKHC